MVRKQADTPHTAFPVRQTCEKVGKLRIPKTKRITIAWHRFSTLASYASLELSGSTIVPDHCLILYRNIRRLLAFAASTRRMRTDSHWVTRKIRTRETTMANNNAEALAAV